MFSHRGFPIFCLEEINQVEQAISIEIEDFKHSLWHKIKVGISIGLVALGTYWAFRRYLDEVVIEPENNEQREPSENKHFPQRDLAIVAMIKKEMAMFLLLLAKKQIQELLHKFADQENPTK